LEKTSLHDVVVPQGKHKLIVNAVLRHIQEVCDVTIDHLQDYLTSRSLVNVERAEAVIEELLVRSSNRRVQAMY
jgi:hypothetical protein